MTQKKWIYRFGAGVFEGRSDMKELLGNKGANLAEMATIGLPVPPGFTITTDACRDYLENGHQFNHQVKEQVEEGIAWLERITDYRFGDLSKPLLISVRSGAVQSMPGMMDTVLNLGLNDEIVSELLEKTTSRRFILDCYRRLIEMYGAVVLGIDNNLFDDVVHDFRESLSLEHHVELDDSGWAQIIERYQSLISSKTGEPVHLDIKEQLYTTIGAVFRSWYSPRARSYRAIQGLNDVGGTAVTIQLMVYGNRSNQSASGVAFTRDPSTGEPGLIGEYLSKVQGEDIVDGFHSPCALSDKARAIRREEGRSLQTRMPRSYDELVKGANTLEKRFRDMQEIEFTIEDGQLWFLQTRAAKRTTIVAMKVAFDLLDEGLISKHEVIERVSLDAFQQLRQMVIDPDAQTSIITRGLPASPGAASGQIVFSSDDAVALANKGVCVILVRNETSPKDVEGMNAAKAVLTRRGGMTSHAADIARAIGRPCIVDARFIELDLVQATMKVGSQTFYAGDEITIDGTNGLVLAGSVPMCMPKLDKYGERFSRLIEG